MLGNAVLAADVDSWDPTSEIADDISRLNAETPELFEIITEIIENHLNHQLNDSLITAIPTQQPYLQPLLQPFSFQM